MNILDSVLEEFSPHQAQRCIHVGLLCVQYYATDRPTMSVVVAMLSNEPMSLPEPKELAIFIDKAVEEPETHNRELQNVLRQFLKKPCVHYSDGTQMINVNIMYFL